MMIRSIEKMILKVLLHFTWKSNYGSRLKYRLKKRPFKYEYLDWNIMIYKSPSIIKVKSWSKFLSLNRYSESDKSYANEGVADPFMLSLRGEMFVLYEAIKNGKGEIWCKKLSEDELHSPNRIIVEDFHLSYPFVFNEGDSLYMIPESSYNRDVRLYRCVEFPYSWKIEKILQKGVTFVDTNFLIVDGLYFWFTFDTTTKKERIFYSTSLKSKWIEHCRSNINSYRNAGPFFNNEGVWYRPVQKSFGKYGEGVDLLKIESISINSYQETLDVIDFLEKRNGFSLDGTHHISILKTNKEFIIAVDGKNRNYYKVL